MRWINWFYIIFIAIIQWIVTKIYENEEKKFLKEKYFRKYYLVCTLTIVSFCPRMLHMLLDPVK